RRGGGAARTALRAAPRPRPRALMRRAPIRRLLGWALVAALCVAALTAIVALVTDAWSDVDWRILATSAAFGVFSGTGAAGESVRRGVAARLGAATAAAPVGA